MLMAHTVALCREYVLMLHQESEERRPDGKVAEGTGESGGD